MKALLVVILATAPILSSCQTSGGFYIRPSGVPLLQLDLTGPAPSALVLDTPAAIEIQEGDALRIAVEGSQGAQERLRFRRDGDRLIIDHPRGSKRVGGPPTIRITMAPPTDLRIWDSGAITAPKMSGLSGLVMTGSGNVVVRQSVEGPLVIAISGSGNVTSAGDVSELHVNVSGSGKIDFSAARVDSAKVRISGSANVALASDGVVDAAISGSGRVTVTGQARCSSRISGSGKVECLSQ
jgi:hypothetical protein